jgi:hypothetical protein
MGCVEILAFGNPANNHHKNQKGAKVQRLFLLGLATCSLASANHRADASWSGFNRTATKANEIPKMFHGVYAGNIDSCAATDALETITVKASGIIASEGGQSVVRAKPVSGNANKILVDFKNTGGGEAWSSREYLEISNDKKLLTQSELVNGKIVSSAKYFRCS